MAGFDGGFQADPRDVELLRALSPVVARRARKMRVRWRLELEDTGLGYFTLDGNTYALDMLLERLSRDLPTAADALTSWRAPAARRRLAAGWVHLMVEHRQGGYDGGDNVVPLRSRSKPSKPIIFSLYPMGPNADLWPRLSVTSDVMASWLMDEIAAEVVLEELHTATELVLTRLWKRSKRLSYAELVDHAASLGVLGLPNEIRDWIYEDHPDQAISRRDLLLQLKDERKVVKHRAGVGAEEWLRAHFWPAAQLLEHLTTALDPDGRWAYSEESGWTFPSR